MSTKNNLIELQSVNPNIIIDLRYATTDNFTKKQIYSVAKCYLLKEVAEALSRVQQELEQKGLGLKVWDGYRPISTQWKLWKIVPDERYVSDPRKGGRHTRGTSVDLTLVQVSDGKELVMPTEFDYFSPKAWRDYDDLSDRVKRNRQLLQDVMEKYDFIGLPTEWWHFDYRGWESYKEFDVSLEDLEK
ncbi:MAG TPA: peptidase M15 [Candidatus Dependentiae bacterium]|nr:peptidase M15 [Candidatus Dependentiae bacterium]